MILTSISYESTIEVWTLRFHSSCIPVTTELYSSVMGASSGDGPFNDRGVTANDGSRGKLPVNIFT
ncbi:uncharacterized protein EURHEDRAFT_67338 [Aspergillus ruber CBS 135680]|uniref:Uncharacterized protein n=1 Tax=Aspergillus ruber (strain CBS 135680) TaxID=1388766 RepID=A0A017SEV2_ASPRC|nr:uncharacterized protein EURHEDRAFT_67338 [Aspergillus ruber CBS 135680]EYE95154.1 hypothetical protein EURHEDRAFT_67338 [Aspergillus ruber CBS 135680]